MALLKSFSNMVALFVIVLISFEIKQKH